MRLREDHRGVTLIEVWPRDDWSMALAVPGDAAGSAPFVAARSRSGCDTNQAGVTRARRHAEAEMQLFKQMCKRRQGAQGPEGRRGAQDGFTLVEVATILLALGVMAGMLVPSIGQFNSLARRVRLSEDLGVLCTALKMMLDDVGESAFWGSYGRSYQTGYAVSGYGATSGGQSSPGMANAYSTGVSYNSGGSYQAAGLLVGNGDIPASAIGATQWQLQRGATFIADTDAYYQVGLSFVVDGFADQLIHHGVVTTSDAIDAGGYGYSGPHNLGRYPGTVDSMDMFHWRGPYIADRINADPWGNRYMANVFALHLPPATLYNTHAYWRRHQPFFSSAVVCYSAGPNEQIETAFDQPWGWYTGGDDQTAVLAGVGGIR